MSFVIVSRWGVCVCVCVYRRVLRIWGKEGLGFYIVAMLDNLQSLFSVVGKGTTVTQNTTVFLSSVALLWVFSSPLRGGRIFQKQRPYNSNPPLLYLYNPLIPPCWIPVYIISWLLGCLSMIFFSKHILSLWVLTLEIPY